MIGVVSVFMNGVRVDTAAEVLCGKVPVRATGEMGASEAGVEAVGLADEVMVECVWRGCSGVIVFVKVVAVVRPVLV